MTTVSRCRDDQPDCDRRGLFGRSAHRGSALDGSDESVARARNGLNVPWLLRVIAERFAQLRDDPRDGIRRDDDIRPLGLHQLIDGDQLTGTFREIAQDRRMRAVPAIPWSARRSWTGCRRRLATSRPRTCSAAWIRAPPSPPAAQTASCLLPIVVLTEKSRCRHDHQRGFSEHEC